MSDLHLEQITDEAGFAALEGTWRSVWNSSNDRSPFVTWEWAITSWNHFRRRDRLEILLAKDGDEVLAIAPMLRASLGLGPASQAMLVGIGQETADYGGLLLGERPRETAALFLRYFAEQMHRGLLAVNLTRLQPAGDTLIAVREFVHDSQRSLVLVHEESEPYPSLDLAIVDDPDAFLHRADVRNDVWRTGRRFAEHCDLEFEYDAEPDAANVRALLDLSGRRWDMKAGRMAGLFAGDGGREFVADVVVVMRAVGDARLSLLRADGEVVAARLGFECAGKYLGYKECFDPEFAKFGPGQLLTSRILHRMLECGLSEFDFLRGEGAHKSKWANARRDVGYWTMHRAGLAGGAARRLMWNQMRLRLRRWSR